MCCNPQLVASPLKESSVRYENSTVVFICEEASYSISGFISDVLGKLKLASRLSKACCAEGFTSCNVQLAR